MTRALIVLVCLALAVLLASNRRRAERDAGRAFATMESNYDLPRLGAARDDILKRLEVSKGWLNAGTQLGLVATAATVYLLPDGAGAEPFVFMALIWGLGQVGRLLGALRRTVPGAGMPWREVVPWWMGLPSLLAVVLLGAFVAQCWGSGSAATRDVGTATLLLAVALGALSAWGLRRALRAESFLAAAVDRGWTEALRGDAARAAAVLFPAGVGFGVGALAPVASWFWRDRAAEQSVLLITEALGGVLVAVATLGLAWAAGRWHARRVQATGLPQD